MENKSAEMLKKLQAYNCIAHGCDIGEPELETELQTRFPSFTQTIYDVKIKSGFGAGYQVFSTTNKDEAFDYFEFLRLLFHSEYNNDYTAMKSFTVYLTQSKGQYHQVPYYEFVLEERYNADMSNTILSIVKDQLNPDPIIEKYFPSLKQQA